MEQEDVLIIPNPRGKTTIVKTCTEVGGRFQLVLGESFVNLISKIYILITSDGLVGDGQAQFIEDPVDTFLDSVRLSIPPDDGLGYSRMSGTNACQRRYEWLQFFVPSWFLHSYLLVHALQESLHMPMQRSYDAAATSRWR
jgi:hypothetical protein